MEFGTAYNKVIEMIAPLTPFSPHPQPFFRREYFQLINCGIFLPSSPTPSPEENAFLLINCVGGRRECSWQETFSGKSALRRDLSGEKIFSKNINYFRRVVWVRGICCQKKGAQSPSPARKDFQGI
jgi:hypothetical protein